MRAAYASSSRLVTGGSPSRPGKRTLSRLVTCRRRPWTSHVPPVPSAARSSIVSAGSGSGSSDSSASAAGAPERQTRSGSSATSSLVRPLSTDRGCSSGSQPSTAWSSCLWSSIHDSRSPSAPVRTQDEPPAQLLPVHVGMQLAVADRPARVGGADRLPRPGVPHDDVAAAVLTGRDHALEVEVLDGVVLHVHRQAAHLRVEGRALGHGPAHQHAVDLEPEVVVEAARPVPLHDEPRSVAIGDPLAGRLRGAGEVPLASVGVEQVGHGPAVPGTRQRMRAAVTAGRARRRGPWSAGSPGAPWPRAGRRRRSPR